MIRRLATLLLVATAVACNSEGATAPDRPITAVTVTPGTSAMVIGQSAKLAVAVTGGFSKPTVTWKSSNSNVATVDDTGFVVAKTTGSATISATAGTVTGTSTITVGTGVTSVTVTPPTSSLIVSQSMQLTVAVAGPYLQVPTVAWGSSNNSIVSVDAAGRVTANAVGTATVTATAAGLTGSSTITVTAGVIDRVAVCDRAISGGCTPSATLSAIGTSAVARASAYNTLGADVTSACVFTWAPSAAGVVSMTPAGTAGDNTNRDMLITRTGYGVISIVVRCSNVPGVFNIDGPATAPPEPTTP